MRLVGSEEELSRQLSEWLQYQHRDAALYAHFDYGSGLKMTVSQARRQKALNPTRGWPDVFIAFPVSYPYALIAGLFIELKRDGTALKKRDGSWASPHIAEQAEMLERLASVGYIAEFACGLDEAMALIDRYLGPIKARDVRGSKSKQEESMF